MVEKRHKDIYSSSLKEGGGKMWIKGKGIGIFRSFSSLIDLDKYVTHKA